MTPPLWVASFVLYKNVNGISDRTLRWISGLYKYNDKLDKHIIVLYRDFKLLQVCTNYETGVA